MAADGAGVAADGAGVAADGAGVAADGAGVAAGTGPRPRTLRVSVFRGAGETGALTGALTGSLTGVLTGALTGALSEAARGACVVGATWATAGRVEAGTGDGGRAVKRATRPASARVASTAADTYRALDMRGRLPAVLYVGAPSCGEASGDCAAARPLPGEGNRPKRSNAAARSLSTGFEKTAPCTYSQARD